MVYVKAEADVELTEEVDVKQLLEDARMHLGEDLSFCTYYKRIVKTDSPCNCNYKPVYSHHIKIPNNESLALVILNNCLKDEETYFCRYNVLSSYIQLDFIEL